MGGVNVTNANHVDTGQRHVATLVWSIDPNVQCETRKHMNNGRGAKARSEIGEAAWDKNVFRAGFYVRVY